MVVSLWLYVLIHHLLLIPVCDECVAHEFDGLVYADIIARNFHRHRLLKLARITGVVFRVACRCDRDLHFKAFWISSIAPAPMPIHTTGFLRLAFFCHFSARFR